MIIDIIIINIEFIAFLSNIACFMINKSLLVDKKLLTVASAFGGLVLAFSTALDKFSLFTSRGRVRGLVSIHLLYSL